MIKHFWQDEQGQDLVEYALIVGLISIAAIAVLQSANGGINSVWSSIDSTLNTSAGPASSSPGSGGTDCSKLHTCGPF